MDASVFVSLDSSCATPGLDNGAADESHRLVEVAVGRRHLGQHREERKEAEGRLSSEPSRCVFIEAAGRSFRVEAVNQRGYRKRRGGSLEATATLSKAAEILRLLRQGWLRENMGKTTERAWGSWTMPNVLSGELVSRRRWLFGNLFAMATVAQLANPGQSSRLAD